MTELLHSLTHLLNLLKDFHFNEKVITETSFDYIDNVNGQIKENSKLILTPNYSSTLNIIQSQGHLLSPDFFLMNNSCAANNESELVECLSADIFIKKLFKDYIWNQNMCMRFTGQF